MSVAGRIAFGAGAMWVQRFVTVCLALVLFPVLFRHMPDEELGLWFLLGQAAAFITLLDFGFTLTLTRRIALLEGRTPRRADGSREPDVQAELVDLYVTGRRVYRCLALAVLVLGGAAGWVFLHALPLETVAPEQALAAWAVLCVAYAVITETALFHCALNGAGHVGWDAIVATGTTAVTSLGQIAVVLLGGGLLALAAVTAAGAVVSRIALSMLLRRMEPELSGTGGRFRREVLDDMTGLAVRVWLTALGAFLILKTDQYFIAYFRTAADIPRYHAAFQLVMNCYLLAVAFAAASHVFVSQLWSAGDLPGIHRIVWRNVRLGLGLMVAGVAYLLVCGETVIELWLGEGEFIGWPVLATFCAMLTLEVQHVIMSQACRATRDEPFAPWALAAGVINLVLTWVLIERYGLWGVALATFIAQLVTNNWYAVYRTLRRLEMSVGSYARRAVLPVGALFAATLCGCYLSVGVGEAAGGRLAGAATGAVVVGGLLAAFWWWVALDEPARRILLAKIREQLASRRDAT